MSGNDPWAAALQVMLNPANMTGVDPDNVEEVQLVGLPTIDRAIANRLLELTGKPVSVPPDPSASAGQG